MTTTTTTAAVAAAASATTTTSAATATTTASPSNTVALNEWVVIYRDDGSAVLLKASEGCDLKMSAMRIKGSVLAGLEYGATYEMRSLEEQDEATTKLNAKRQEKHKRCLRYATVVRVDGFEPQELVDEGAEDRDNRNIHDGPNQATDQSQIMALQASGVAGATIVKSLVENNVNYSQKTSMSQAKYVKRLAQKHMPRFLVVRSTPRTIAEAVTTKNPASLLTDRHRSLRWSDSLPQLLAYANVHASSRVLCLDGVGGMLILSVVDRLSPEGCCINVVTAKRDMQKQPGQVHFLNLPRARVAQVLVNVATVELTGSASLDDDGPASDGDDNDESASKRVRADPAEAKAYARVQARAAYAARRAQVLADVRTHGADALIVASQHDCWQALETLLPSLGSGMAFVVHSPTLEPLMRCRAMLQGRAVGVQVSETFCREIQVLPMRTHPLVTQSASGGFILRGVKICA